jgi:hypothetical protein
LPEYIEIGEKLDQSFGTVEQNTHGCISTRGSMIKVAGRVHLAESASPESSVTETISKGERRKSP